MTHKTHYIEISGDDVLREGDLRTSKGKRVFVEVIGVLNGQTVADRKPAEYDYYRPMPDAFAVRTLPIDKPEAEGIDPREHVLYWRDGLWSLLPSIYLLDGTKWLPNSIGLSPHSYDKLTAAGLILLPNRHDKQEEPDPEPSKKDRIKELVEELQSLLEDSE